MIEVIIALGIMGILLSITILDTDIIYKVKLNKEALEFKRDIEKVRMDSLKRSTSSSVLLDSKENSYKLKVKEKEGSGFEIVKSVYPETFKIVTAEGEYEFTRAGTPSKAGTITLEHKYGRWDITIQPVTGKTNLKK